MKLLALESSTAYGGACLYIGDNINASGDEIATQKMRSHSEVLNSYVEELLKKNNTRFQELDAIGVGIGPGSFTGIRVAFNCAKTLAYAFNKPLIAIDSLANLANVNSEILNLPSTHIESMHSSQASNSSQSKLPIINKEDLVRTPLIIPMINAYKNMVYTAIYKKVPQGLLCLQEPQVVRVQELVHFIQEPSWCVGDGFSTYEKYFSDDLLQKTLRKQEFIDYPTPASCAFLAAQKLFSKEKSTLLNWTEITPLYLRASEAEENKKGIKYQAL